MHGEHNSNQIHAPGGWRLRLREPALAALCGTTIPVTPCLSFPGAPRDPVKSTPTGAVDRISLPGGVVFRKVYRYPTCRSILSGALRTTFLAPGRVAREWRALAVLAAHGLQPDLRLAMAERRGWGFLREAILVTREFAGERLDRFLARSGPEGREAVVGALWSWIERVHGCGHRDRNLDARNLLVRVEYGGIRFAKIDSPKSFRVGAGGRMDRWRRADLRRLRGQVDAALPSSGST